MGASDDARDERGYQFRFCSVVFSLDSSTFIIVCFALALVPVRDGLVGFSCSFELSPSFVDPNQVSAVSIGSAVTGVATATISLTGVPNGDGARFWVAFALSADCGLHRVGASLLSAGGKTMPSVTFGYQGTFYVCWSTDSGETYVQQATPTVAVTTSSYDYPRSRSPAC
jgi:hypothetical protein